MKVGPIDVAQFAAGSLVFLLLIACACAVGVCLGKTFAAIAAQEDEIRRLDGLNTERRKMESSSREAG